VTFEKAAPKATPTVTIGQSKDGSSNSAIKGVTHTHTTSAGDRTYYMHFVRISGLKERTR
jgi:hypothetical protein